VPGGGDWVVDSFSDGEDRMQIPQFSSGLLGLEFEVAAQLCETFPPSMQTSAVSPTTGKEYHCGAFGSMGSNNIDIRMYGPGNPLQFHMSLYSDNTYYNGNKRIVNITDTTIDLVDAATNQTIQKIPAKVANIILVRLDYSDYPTTAENHIDTVLYATMPGTSDTYVVTHSRYVPDRLAAEDEKAIWAANEAVVKEIFDSFRIISKQGTTTSSSSSPPAEEEVPMPDVSDVGAF
jgi:hypothetical protein